MHVRIPFPCAVEAVEAQGTHHFLHAVLQEETVVHAQEVPPTPLQGDHSEALREMEGNDRDRKGNLVCFNWEGYGSTLGFF